MGLCCEATTSETLPDEYRSCSNDSFMSKSVGDFVVFGFTHRMKCELHAPSRSTSPPSCLANITPTVGLRLA